MKVGISSNVVGGFGIWNCEFFNVGLIVLDVCSIVGGKVFKELGLLLFVEDCCI